MALTLVKITWNDAQDHSGKWVDAEDAATFGEVDCQVISVGFLVKKTDKYITIAGDYDPTDNDYGRVTKIPVVFTTLIEEL